MTSAEAAARSTRWPLWIALLAAYAGLLASLTRARPLWLDEILELLVTREAGLPQRLQMIHETPGAVPLGYEVQHLVTRILGQSIVAARIPSELFSILGLVLMVWLARVVQARDRLFVAVIWALLPLFLRYAVEGRPYSQALALSALATILMLRILREPRIGWAALYGVTVMASLLTQPYSLFLQIGLLAPLVFEKHTPHLRRALLLCTASLGAAGAAFLPWVLWSAREWTQYASGMREDFHLTGKLPLQLAREISGGSYVCFASLLGFVALGCGSRRLHSLIKRQLLAGIGACVLLAIVGDWSFHYFFATRQVIFILIPMCLLAGEGWAEAGATGRASDLRLALAALLVISALIKDVRYFRDGSEDWQSAAGRLEQATRSSCIVYPASDAPGLYEYFEPRLRQRRCQPEQYTQQVIMPVSRYSSPETVRETVSRLAAQGYSMYEVEHAGEAIEIRRFGVAKAAAAPNRFQRAERTAGPPAGRRSDCILRSQAFRMACGVPSRVNSRPSCRYGGDSLIPRNGNVSIGPSAEAIMPLINRGV